MNKTAIPQSVVDRVIARRGREHIHDDLDPARTALVVVDMQNAFMLPGVAHSLCLQAQGIVPNINRLAQAVRETGGTVVWIQGTYTDETKVSWSVYYEISKPEQNRKRAEALTPGSKGYELWAELDARPDDLYVQKNRFSAFIQGASNLAEVLRSRGLDTILVTGTVTNVCCEFDRTRRHDAQFQDHHDIGWQCGGDRRGPQRCARQFLPYLRRRDVDRFCDRVPAPECEEGSGGGGVTIKRQQCRKVPARVRQRLLRPRRACLYRQPHLLRCRRHPDIRRADAR